MPDPIDQSGQTMHAFLDQVMDRAPQVDSVGEAEKITRGTLATLAQAVSHGELDAMADALPPELRDELGRGPDQAEALGLPEFVDRAGGHSSSTAPEVVEQQARAVLRTVARWTPAEEVDDVQAQLPKSVRVMFDNV